VVRIQEREGEGASKMIMSLLHRETHQVSCTSLTAGSYCGTAVKQNQACPFSCVLYPWPYQDWTTIMDGLLAKYATRLLKLGVDEIEVKVRVEVDGNDGTKSIQPVRLMVGDDSTLIITLCSGVIITMIIDYKSSTRLAC
jgi:hypothetical protein